MDTVNEWLSNVQFTDSNWVFLLPCALMALDVLTGVVHAWATGHLKSYRMREGLGRKFGEVSILVIGALFTQGIGLPIYLFGWFSIYIIVMELISICENLDKLGVPIPKFIKKALGQVNDNIQNGRKVGEEPDERGSGTDDVRDSSKHDDG